MQGTVRIGITVVTAIVLLGFHPVSAQVGVTAGDIQRLQDAVYDAGNEISRLRDRDAELARSLQAELEELRDEVTYLRVKLQREGNVPRSEYTDLRDRIEDLRGRARGDQVRAVSPTAPASPYEVPVGTEIDVRLQATLSSETARVEDRFEATTAVDLVRADRVLVPAGSVVRGVVSSVQPAGRINRTGRMTLAFDQITVQGRTYPMQGTVTQALESEGIRGEAGRIGTGAAVGAVIGGILGGARGALAGILIGGGGVVAATEGEDVQLPAGTILRVRFDAPLTLEPAGRGSAPSGSVNQ